MILINVSEIYHIHQILYFQILAKNIQLKVAENHQLWKEYFDSLLRLNIHAIVKETGQIYRREKYILNEENITLKLVRLRKTISV